MHPLKKKNILNIVFNIIRFITILIPSILVISILISKTMSDDKLTMLIIIPSCLIGIMGALVLEYEVYFDLKYFILPSEKMLYKTLINGFCLFIVIASIISVLIMVFVLNCWDTSFNRDLIGIIPGFMLLAWIALRIIYLTIGLFFS